MHNFYLYFLLTVYGSSRNQLHSWPAATASTTMRGCNLGEKERWIEKSRNEIIKRLVKLTLMMGTQFEFIAASRREMIITNLRLHFALDFQERILALRWTPLHRLCDRSLEVQY